MAQIQQLDFAPLAIKLNKRLASRGLRLLATPGLSDGFRMHDGSMIEWADLERSYPAVPPEWWCNMVQRSAVPQPHVWMYSKGWLRNGQCRLARLHIVEPDQHLLPANPVGEFLVRDIEHDSLFVNVVAHLARVGIL